MKRKIETSLRRAMDQLPQPDYWTVAEAPVQKMEVHDYVTRQDVSVRPVRRRALPLALAACALALARGTISPTIHLEEPDPACDLDYVPGAARAAQAEIAISVSLGFGGHNAAIALRRCV